MTSLVHHALSILTKNRSTAHFFSLCDATISEEETTVARINYKFQKRQKEIERKKKKEEKKQARLDGNINQSEKDTDDSSNEDDLQQGEELE